MSTTAAPYGARPIGTTSASGSFTGKTRAYRLASGTATAIFVGDFVKMGVTGYVEKDTGTASLTPTGIFMGCSYTDTNGQLQHNVQWPAALVSADAVAYVLDDPEVLFQMQADEAVTINNWLANFAVVQTAGSTKIGASKNAVDGGSGANTNTFPLKLVDFVDGPDSAIGDTYTDVVVKFNVGHQLVNTTGVALS